MTFLATQCQTHKPIAQIAGQAFEQHATYKEPAVSHRRFKHEDIVPLLEQLKQHPLFEVQVVGQSVEARDIYLVKVGTGKTKVMLWSQMHGDEPTATMALLDLFNFLQKSDALDPVRQHILQNTTLYIVPMLNPDGAEQYKRRNALGLDLNRDALRLQSPEARLLKSLRDSLDPEFGFNLHDQSRHYTVGTTPKPATISFLAPAYDHAQSVNEVRDRAMRTIVGMNEALQQFIPGQVAKYSDEHEPRAFGDNIQKWGTSVILIESGGYKGDPEKQYIRQLNFASIVSALHLIGDEGYKAYDRKDYFKIPENERYLFDLVLRGVRYQEDGQNTLLDVGINHSEVKAANAKGFYQASSIEEIGDMSVFYGYEELDAAGLTLVPGKVYASPFKNLSELTPARSLQLLQEGYTTVRVETLPHATVNPLELPLNVTTLSGTVNHRLGLDRGAHFVLQDEKGQVRYAIVNGFVYDLQGSRPALFHGLVL
ncbi:peptidase M14 [Pontibacter sp. HJ8]